MIKNFFNVLLFLMLLFIVLPFMGIAQVPITKYVGNWSQMEIDFRGWDEGKCQMIMVIERRYSLAIAGDNKLKGTYMNIDHGRWLNSNKARCNAPGEDTFKTMFSRARLWMIEGEIDPTGNLSRIQGSFDCCKFMYCDEPGLNKKDFNTKLKIQADGHLADFSGADVTDEDFIFTRKEDLEKKAKDHSKEFEKILQVIEDGDFNRFYDNFVSSYSKRNYTRIQAEGMYKNLKANCLDITRRELLEAKYGNSIYIYLPDKKKYHVECLFLLNEVSGSRGKGVEVSVLILEKGIWKLYLMGYV